MRRSVLMTVVLALAFAAQVSAASVAQAGHPCLVPWPQKLTMRPGSFTAPKSLSVRVTARNASARMVAATFAEDLRGIGFAPGGKETTGIVLALAADPLLGNEGYRLEVNKGIRITAPTEAGLFWGTRTALQLLAKGPGRPVPHLSIWDKPLLPFRGVMVDVARQFHSIGFHRQMVKKLASYKLNVYHIHFNDDQSYTLPSDKYPNLPTPGRHYTKDELKDLVKLGARYHVTILPEVETIGHNTAVTSAIPDAMCRGLGPRGLVCAGSDRSFEIVKTLISETMDIFPSHYFHIGADEVDFNAWDKCPDCTARRVSEGFATSESLYTWFINRVNRFVRSKGRQAIAWDGFSLKTRPAVDKNVLIDEWDIGSAKPGDLLAAGYDLLNATGNPLYVCRGWFSSPEMIAEWDVWHFDPVTHPVDTAPRIAPTSRLRGACFCSWENAENVQDSILFGKGGPFEGYATPAPRVPILAERAWTGGTTSKEDLLERVGVKAAK